MSTPNAEATRQEGSVAMDYTGTNQGSIAYVNRARGADAVVYRASSARKHHWAHPDDVLYLESTGKWQRAPVEKQAAKPDEVAPDADLPLALLDISTTAIEGLAAANITTIEQAQNLSDETLDSIPGVGAASIKKIREAK